MFSRSALILFIASAAVLFALSVILSGVSTGPVSAGDDGLSSHSPSAAGYAGFYEFLHRTGRTVARNTDNATAIAGQYGTVIVAEPNISFIDEDAGVLKSPRLLLVLPKWEVHLGGEHEGWAERMELLARKEVGQTAEALGLDVQIVRQKWPEWTSNTIGQTPTGEGNVQLMRSDNMTPLVAHGKDILLGEIASENQRIWVLSDPDLINNHGIFKGENILFISEALDKLRFWNNSDPGMPIVFDEVVHGYHIPVKSPISLLFQFPYSVVAALVLATALLMLFSGVGRFGPPAYKEELLDFGKERLISNSARLLDYSGHHRSIMLRYIDMTVAIVARTLHAPSSLKGAELPEWLDRVGASRGLETSCVLIMQAVGGIRGESRESLERLFMYVKQIYQWKGEMLNGSAGNWKDR